MNQFDPAEGAMHNEQKASLALLSRMDSDARKTHREPKPDSTVLNVRKAVRFASKGSGALALGRESAKGKGNKSSTKRRR
jgi:regulator of ribosome biosynthesis